MDNKLSKNKLMLERTQVQAAICSHKEYVWKNIFKVEALRKENSLRKSQILCQNLRITDKA